MLKRLVNVAERVLTHDNLFPLLCFAAAVIAFSPFIESGCNAVMVDADGAPLNDRQTVTTCPRCGGFATRDPGEDYCCHDCQHEFPSRPRANGGR